MIVTEADDSAIMQGLTNEAKFRGLPLLYPLMDLEDSVRLSTAEVWGLFLDRIDAASIRYNADVVLTGRVQKDASGQWNGRWYYRLDRRWQTLDNIAFSAEQLVSGVMNQMADKLAAQYAVGSLRGSVLLRVDGVKDLESYAAVSDYVQSLTPVVDSFVVEVVGDEILFRLQTEGQSEQLMEIIGLDQKLLLISPGSGSTEQSAVQFRWIGR